MYKTIALTQDARGVVTLSLVRPEKHNALSRQMLLELTDAAQALAVDPTVRVIVLRGQGATFCAGGDLAWMQAQMQANSETRAAEARILAMTLYHLNTLPQPLIGALQGNAFGGGVGLASVCDVAIGLDHLKMGLTETRLGLIPATIGPYVLARMGEAKARRVFLSGRIFSAAEAVQLGLLARAVPAESFEAEIESEVTPYLACAPSAVAAAKKLTRDLGPKIDETVIDHTISALVACWEGNEAQEGITAFFEKRAPAWKR
ncbi:crotonase/enoyl-CoA hydratase family protein [Epibacterium ulvae]|uniref:crotonase/enoyl-CoA hydratase family protein n=1 Tax=Epibacterium ulvae TaxID=1156985 RepID=UPI0024925955|nr:crotonase/enoyl-CoA hydratase family protein [Epibacterium ulvae]